MAYSGVTETVVLFPGLPQTTTSDGWTETAALVGNMADKAMAKIDAYCARRYSVPFGGGTSTGSVPPFIRDLSEDITGFYVYRAYYPKDSVAYNDWLDKLNEAMSDLKDLREGLMDLSDTAGSVLVETTAEQKIASNTENYSPTFDFDDTLNGWEVDPDRVDDAESGRG